MHASRSRMRRLASAPVQLARCSARARWRGSAHVTNSATPAAVKAAQTRSAAEAEATATRIATISGPSVQISS